MDNFTTNRQHLELNKKLPTQFNLLDLFENKQYKGFGYELFLLEKMEQINVNFTDQFLSSEHFKKMIGELIKGCKDDPLNFVLYHDMRDLLEFVKETTILGDQALKNLVEAIDKFTTKLEKKVKIFRLVFLTSISLDEDFYPPCLSTSDQKKSNRFVKFLIELDLLKEKENFLKLPDLGKLVDVFCMIQFELDIEPTSIEVYFNSLQNLLQTYKHEIENFSDKIGGIFPLYKDVHDKLKKQAKEEIKEQKSKSTAKKTPVKKTPKKIAPKKTPAKESQQTLKKAKVTPIKVLKQKPTPTKKEPRHVSFDEEESDEQQCASPKIQRPQRKTKKRLNYQDEQEEEVEEAKPIKKSTKRNKRVQEEQESSEEEPEAPPTKKPIKKAKIAQVKRIGSPVEQVPKTLSSVEKLASQIIQNNILLTQILHNHLVQKDDL